MAKNPSELDRYENGPVHGTVTCVVCGAVVNPVKTDVHDKHHDNEGRVARAAYNADMMFRPIG